MNKQETYKMDKDYFLAIFNEDITVRQRKEIIRLMEQRMEYIMRTLFELNGGTVYWYDFDNNCEESDGHFDPDRYRLTVNFTGDWKTGKHIVTDHIENQEFPTRWFYEDFEEEVVKSLAEKKDKVEQKRLTVQQKKEVKQQRAKEVKARIVGKLTPEELSYIKFK